MHRGIIGFVGVRQFPEKFIQFFPVYFHHPLVPHSCRILGIGHPVAQFDKGGVGRSDNSLIVIVVGSFAAGTAAVVGHGINPFGDLFPECGLYVIISKATIFDGIM